MIRIEKTIETPPVLLEQGHGRTQEDEAAYDRYPEDFASGERTFDFHRLIYGHETVREALRTAQYGKCCYCESKFLSTSPGHVEHYRPKGAVKQDKGSQRERPGYYWLAYDWDNLLMSCPVCNTRKGILFPLADGDARARDHHGAVEREQPLLIHPVNENPRDHVRFRGDEPQPVTPTGTRTIEVLELRGHDLQESRRELLRKLKTLKAGADLFRSSYIPDDGDVHAWIEEAEQLLDDAIRSDAEFSSMATDMLND